ncbi:MAG: helix-turn-helix domain-containing protein [Sinimarinibacterium sp.]|jgi:AraC-like DNA-binding protein
MWTGNARLEPGWAVFIGTAGDHAPHRHHAVQVVLGMQGPVSVWAAARGEIAAAGAVIAADCPHQLASGLAPLLLVYLERESAAGRRLDAWCAGQTRVLSRAQVQALHDLLCEPSVIDAARIAAVVEVILDRAAVTTGIAFHDARIASSIAGLGRPLPERLPLAQLAAAAGLSPSRYAHLFRAHTGMPLRPYLRWLRLQHALGEIAAGATATDAAHAAGFADSAHLSRTFRATFGVTPSVLMNPALSLTAA